MASSITQATVEYLTLIVLWDGGGVSMEQKTLAAFLLTNFPHVVIRTGWHNETIFGRDRAGVRSVCFVLPFVSSTALGAILILILFESEWLGAILACLRNVRFLGWTPSTDSFK